jgi:hypothetical protein
MPLALPALGALGFQQLSAVKPTRFAWHLTPRTGSLARSASTQ